MSFLFKHFTYGFHVMFHKNFKGPPGGAGKPGAAGPTGPPGKPGEPGQDGQYCACPPRTSLSKGALFVAQRYRDIQALEQAAAA